MISQFDNTTDVESDLLSIALNRYVYHHPLTETIETTAPECVSACVCVCVCALVQGFPLHQTSVYSSAVMTVSEIHTHEDDDDDEDDEDDGRKK